MDLKAGDRVVAESEPTERPTPLRRDRGGAELRVIGALPGSPGRGAREHLDAGPGVLHPDPGGRGARKTGTRT
jgi:hypothetical protein